MIPTRLIRLQPTEVPLSAGRVDARLEAGWFPYGQGWMTCEAWPSEDGTPFDTVWVRVALASRPRHDRHRRAARAGITASRHESPQLDDEHEALYQRFKAALHPDWGSATAAELLLHGAPEFGPLHAHTREIALRDADGRLRAFRWFLEGDTAIAGISAVYDPEWSGLGGAVRRAAEDDATARGRRRSYPGYVRPGATEHMLYKIRPGRTQWLDAFAGIWRDWDSDCPGIGSLVLGQMRGRLQRIGAVEVYPRWAASCFGEAPGELVYPLYVRSPADPAVVIVWDPARAEYLAFRESRRAPAAPPPPLPP